MRERFHRRAGEQQQRGQLRYGYEQRRTERWGYRYLDLEREFKFD